MAEIEIENVNQQNGLIQFTLEELASYTNGFSHRIGAGTYGEVFRGSITMPNGHGLPAIDVAIKRSFNKDSKSIIMWEAEKDLSSCNHLNVIKLFGYYDDEVNYKLYLVYPYHGGGSLQDALPGLNWQHTIKIIKGIASGLDHIHTRLVPEGGPIIHGDLKPDNILLDNDYNAIICDFGTAMRPGDAHECGTLGYIDRETQVCVQPSTDIFSYGIILLQLMTKKSSPFITRNQLIKDVEEGTLRKMVASSLCQSGCSNEERKFMIRLALDCVDRTLTVRPATAEAILERLDSISKPWMRRALKLMMCSTSHS